MNGIVQSRSRSESSLTDVFEDQHSVPTLNSTPPDQDDSPPQHQPSDDARSIPDGSGGIDPATDPRVEAPRVLQVYDVAALIINKMIGSGIFTGPFTVLAYTRSKQVAVGLWILGFSYTIFSMIMYLEYARKLPFTGGELVYLDDLMPKRRLWAYTLYAFYFMFVYTSCTNAMQFGKQVLLAASGEASPSDDDLDQRLVRFIAVVVTTAVCFLLWVSNQTSRLFNRGTAAAKLLLLVFVSGFGVAYLSRHGVKMGDWGTQNQGKEGEDKFLNGYPDTFEFVPAFIIVIFSFHGWENATLVAGEIPTFHILRKGFILAVSLVGTLYLLVVCLFCLAFDWNWVENNEKGPLRNFTAAYFGTNNTGVPTKSAATAAAIIIAISSVGSMISVAYTGVRVKQSIGWTGIFPWSWYWRCSGPLRPRFGWRLVSSDEREIALILDHDALVHPGSPEGGIVLHWIVSVVYVCITAVYDNLDRAINFSGNLLVYGHFCVEGFVAIGFIWFDPYHANFLQFGFPAEHWLDVADRAPPWWMRRQHASGLNLLEWIMKGRGQTGLGLVVFGFSLAVVVVDFFRKEGRISLYIMLGILGLAWVYWFSFVRYASASRIYDFFGFKMHTCTHGADDVANLSRRCHWCHRLPQGAPHRHPHDSYKAFNEVTAKEGGRGFRLRTRILYTIFSDRSRPNLVIHPWSAFTRALRACFASQNRDEEEIHMQNTS